MKFLKKIAYCFDRILDDCLEALGISDEPHWSEVDCTDDQFWEVYFSEIDVTDDSYITKPRKTRDKSRDSRCRVYYFEDYR